MDRLGLYVSANAFRLEANELQKIIDREQADCADEEDNGSHNNKEEKERLKTITSESDNDKDQEQIYEIAMWRSHVNQSLKRQQNERIKKYRDNNDFIKQIRSIQLSPYSNVRITTDGIFSGTCSFKNTEEGHFFWFNDFGPGLPAKLIGDKIHIYITTPDIMTFTINIANNFLVTIIIHDIEQDFYFSMLIPNAGHTKGENLLKMFFIYYDSLFISIFDQNEGYAVQIVDGNARFTNSKWPCQYFMEAERFFTAIFKGGLFSMLTTNERLETWGVNFTTGSKFKWSLWLKQNMKPVDKSRVFSPNGKNIN